MGRKIFRLRVNYFWRSNILITSSGWQGLVTQSSAPSRSPRKELDFILHSAQIEVNRFEIPDVRFSDHLPLICDFTIHQRILQAA